jgi:hypothetical protein
MSDEKDRPGDKLQQAEMARENSVGPASATPRSSKGCAASTSRRSTVRNAASNSTPGWQSAWAASLVQPITAHGLTGRRSSSFAHAWKMRRHSPSSPWAKRCSSGWEKSSKTCLTGIPKRSIAPCGARAAIRDRPGRGRIGRDGLSEPQRRVDRLGYAGGNPPTPGRRRGYPQQPSRRVRYSQIRRKPEYLVYRFHLLG